MMAIRAGGLPAALTRGPLAVTSNLAAETVYAHPRAQLARLERLGLLHKYAPGVYAFTPRDRVGDPTWLPTLEAAAVGIAALEFGQPNVTLLGLSAARQHGAVPRALGAAVVGAPLRKNPTRLTDRDAVVTFAVRTIDKIDIEIAHTDLGPCLITTPEQTVLDLASRPSLGGFEPAQAWEAIRILLPRCDRARLQRIAATGGRRRALATIDRETGAR